MVQTISPFLAFTGQGRAAIDHYLDVFPDAQLEVEHLYGDGEDGPEGTVKLAVLRFGGGTLRIIDAPAEDGFDKTTGVSIFVDCDSADEVDSRARGLARDGAEMMPAGEYPFADRFAWVADRFGVNWQLIYGHRLEANDA